MLKIHNLNKSFGNLTVANNININFFEGKKYAIIGPNGSGKTSLLNMITGKILQDSGNIILDKININKKSTYNRVKLGVTKSFQINNLFQDSTVYENIYYSCIAKNNLFENLITNHRKTLKEHIKKIAKKTDLEHVLQKKVSKISYGHQRQLEFAITLATDVSYILLDEPTSGTSSKEALSLINIIKKIKQKTIIIIDHDINFIENIADEIIVLNQGKIVEQGSIAKIKNSAKVNSIYFGKEL